MKRYTIGLVSTVLTAVLWLMPQLSLAFTAELVSITPSATDLSDQIGSDQSELTIFGWLTELDTAYTAVFAVDESPALVVTPGGDIDPDNRWTYDAAAGTVTVPFTANGLLEQNDVPDGMGVSVIGMMPAVPLDQDGPPAEMTGAWMSTNIEDWDLIPPSEDNVAFGFNLSGPAGSDGFFHMFIPSALIDLLGEFSGQDLTADDLAVFNDDAQASLAVTEIEGGAYIDINVTFDDTDTTVTAVAASTVTKKITAAPKLAVSLAARDTQVAAGDTVHLYGWLKNAKKNQTVSIWQKPSGTKKFTKVKTIKTGNAGKYTVKLSPNKTTTYQVKYKTKTSPKQKVVVK
ncbi:MAG: hypothetical protein HYV33_04870 [Candidatus Kerfeldbacteria bacterium]|nr:hypothetical protein [Candidatus Kerfeldbacteria bacterium]